MSQAILNPLLATVVRKPGRRLISWLVVLTVPAMLDLAVFVPAAHAQNAGGPTVAELGGQALIDAANKEGAVTFYTAEVPDIYRAQIKKFNSHFPGIKVEVVRAPGPQLDTQIRAEVQAGKFHGDIVSNTGDDLMENYRSQLKILSDYKSPEAGFYTQSDTSGDKWYPLSVIVNGFAYNTALVKPADAPKSWQDFLNPAYNGRRGYVLPNASCFMTAVWFTGQVLGIDKGKPYNSYWKALAATKPTLYSASTQMISPVAQGQNIISYMIDSLAPPGGQVKFVYPTEGAPSCWHSAQVAMNAPHPNAARLFLNYLLSHEGQAIGVNEFRTFSFRTDMPAPVGVPAGFKVWRQAPGFGAQHPTWQQEWLTIFGAKI
jgi:iron(III) transport system substrate-binding protein